MSRKCFILIGLTALLSTFVLPAMAAKTLHVPTQFPTIQDAVTAANSGDRIIVGPYTGPGALIDKTVEITGSGAATIIDSPATSTQPQKAAFYIPYTPGANAIHTKITHLTIEGSVTCPIGVYAEGQHFITLEHLLIKSIHQGITNHGGSHWRVTNNNIVGLVAYPGGIDQVFGILVSGNKGPNGNWATAVEHNVVENNHIDGTNTNRHSDPVRGPLYCKNRFGIRLNSHGDTACFVQKNQLRKNTVTITKLFNPAEKYAVGIALTNSSRKPSCPDPAPSYYLPHGVRDNVIRANNVCGSEIGIGTYPPCNDLNILSGNSKPQSDNPGVAKNRGNTYVLRTGAHGEEVTVLIEKGRCP